MSFFTADLQLFYSMIEGEKAIKYKGFFKGTKAY